MDQHDLHVLRWNSGVIREHPAREVVQTTGHLGAGEAAPGDHTGQHGPPFGLVGLRTGAFEHVDDVIAQPSRVGERLEVECLVLDVSESQIVGDRPQRQDEMVEWHLRRHQRVLVRCQPHTPSRKVDVCNRTADDLGAPQAGAQRTADVRRLEAARGDFGQHWREQECVGVAHQGQ
jgi:hypothetical protein